MRDSTRSPRIPHSSLTNIMASQPAWQTDELKDEWPDEDDDISEPCTRSISLTIPVGSIHHSGTGLSQDTGVTDVLGTLLIRQDALPTLPQRTLAQRKGLIKDFFSPIALERMFDPPSPGTSVQSPCNIPSSPLQSSAARLSQVTSVNGQEDLVVRRVAGADSWRPDMSCEFTFAVPRPASFTDVASPSCTQDKDVTSTTASVAPLTDPPLRLFQFQYDTFTRDHLSAMVDSLAINSPSGSNTANLVASTSSPFGLATVSEASSRPSSIELRSAKRVKLSPASDFHGSYNRVSCSVRRPGCRKDYVGESRFLMAQIKNARDFSFSIPASASVPYPNSNGNTPYENEAQGQRESSVSRAPFIPLIFRKPCKPPLTSTHMGSMGSIKILSWLGRLAPPKGRAIPPWATDNRQRT
jgi:hypothetical protein